MTSRSRPRTQLVLALEREERFRPVTHAPEGLVQALADLLLEALAADVALTANGKGTRDESEDHV